MRLSRRLFSSSSLATGRAADPRLGARALEPEDGTWAIDTVERLLARSPARLAHSRHVAEQASKVGHLLSEPWRSALAEAALLHDIGYASSLIDTGFHPLDGARWLRAQDRRPEVCRLVAWHTRARTEARLRGLEALLLAEFPAPPAAAQAVLTWADLTSSPTGEQCSPAIRISDILHRYGPAALVHQATLANEAELLEDARSVDDLVATLSDAR